MKYISRDYATKVLTELIAIPSTNPMGHPYSGTRAVEAGIADYIERLFAPFAVEMHREICGQIHENLTIAVPGRHPSTGSARLFESHMDTVPADGWGDCAFDGCVEDDMIVGRGACDAKGALTSIILALLDLASCGEVADEAVLFLAAGDEEFGQSGIRHFRETSSYRLSSAIVGEPTRLQPVNQHKGVVRWTVSTLGQSAHSAYPERGANAIEDMARVVGAIKDFESVLQHRASSAGKHRPTIAVTQISGGTAPNVVPDRCDATIDMRLTASMLPSESREEVVRVLATLPVRLEHSAPQLIVPPLRPFQDSNKEGLHPFYASVVKACREAGVDAPELCEVAYGTDAAWVGADTPTVVLGPGDIAVAHTRNERVHIDEIVQCAHIYRTLMTANESDRNGSGTTRNE